METRQIQSGDEKILSDFFRDIAEDKEVIRFFHPHPFTDQYAKELIKKLKNSKDMYFVTVDNGAIVGYSMLRGWDEGYKIPSFGICIHPKHQGKGIGKIMTKYAIQKAIERGAPKMMLKVYKDNEAAKHLYAKYGFKFEGETEDKEQYIGYLKLT